MSSRFRRRWEGEGGYREVMTIALPLIISTGSWSLQHYIDRTFLTWYDRDALAAALPAGMVNFTFGSFFLGIASYTNTFVAQYSGAGRPERVGASVWQGIYFSAAAGFLMLGLIPLSETLFGWVGHAPRVQRLEVDYFNMLCLMAGPTVMMSAVSAFYTGRGDTRTVMWANLCATGMNILLDYAWIFGKWGFPEWGIKGAGAATVVAHVFGLAIVAARLFSRPFRETYGTLRNWRPDGELFRRMMRFGVPNGVQFTLDVSGFTLFVLLVGRLGPEALSATNIAMNINTLAFLPMLGISVTASTLVGRYVGRKEPDLAERATWSSVHVGVGYMLVMAGIYLGLPDLLLAPYRAYSDPATFEPIFRTVVVLLVFVAAYSVFDAIMIILSGALKGAGDTAFVMVTSVAVNWGLMVLPVYVGIVHFGLGLIGAWSFLCLFIVVTGLIFVLRFRQGKWRSMQVIESASVVPSTDPEGELAGRGDTPPVA